MGKKMKVIAWHLPQFHRIPENDAWWGEGFTEWTSVKRSKPLYKGHHQPREPLDDNYYDMLDKATMEWQNSLCKQYGVYGFCYYHYWFEGKLLLEKPTENLLKWKDIDQKFCFSWANGSWTRTWSGKESNTLIQQTYGGQEDWKNHMEYLLPFFKDERYIRIEDKPVFLLYQSHQIEELDEMMAYFDQYAIDSGLSGIYFVETLNSHQQKPYSDKSDAVVWMEPMMTINQIEGGRIKKACNRILQKICNSKSPYYVNYDDIIKVIEKRQMGTFKSKAEYLSAFVDWDNTPRRQAKGKVIKGTDPKKFKKQLAILVDKTNEDIIFINAWNEWAEGTYLEPDKKNGYAYLEAIRDLTGNQEGV